MKGLEAREDKWNDYTFDQKLVVYECPVDISGVVDDEDLREFERGLALEGYFGVEELAKEATRSFAGRLTGRK